MSLSTEPKPGTQQDIKEPRATHDLPPPEAIAEIAAGVIFSEDTIYSPASLLQYTDNVRQLVRKGDVQLRSRQPQEVGETSTALYEFIAEHHQELLAAYDLSTDEVRAHVKRSVLACMRESVYTAGHTKGMRNRFGEFDLRTCYGFAMVTLRDLAELRPYNLDTASLHVHHNSATFLKDLLEDEHCHLPIARRKTLIRNRPHDPEIAIEEGKNAVQKLGALAAQHNITLPKSALHAAATWGLAPEDVVGNLTVALQEFAGHDFITPAVVKSFCTGYADPLDRLRKLEKLGSKLIEKKGEGYFADLSEADLVRIARTPQKAEEMLQRTVNNKTALDQAFEARSLPEWVQTQLLRSDKPIANAIKYLNRYGDLEKINREQDIKAGDILLQKMAFANRPATPEAIRYENRLYLLRSATQRLAMPEWLPRIITERYPDDECSLEDALQALRGAASLIEAGCLQFEKLTYDLAPDERGNVDKKTCHYPVFSEKAKQTLELHHRMALSHLFGRLDMLFYNRDVSEELVRQYGDHWQTILLQEIVRRLPDSPIIQQRLSSLDTPKKPSKRQESKISASIFKEKPSKPTNKERAELNIKLADEMQAGVYAQAILEGITPVPPSVRTAYNMDGPEIPSILKDDLSATARRGKEARAELIEANQNLAVRIALRPEYQFRGLDLDDLISEGIIGLIQTIKLWDHRRGNLSTLAELRIKREIQRAISNTGRLVRLPVGLDTQRDLVVQAFNELIQQKGGQEPSVDDIAKATSLPPSKVYDLLYQYGIRPVSIFAPLKGDDSRTLIDVLSNSNNGSLIGQEDLIDRNDLSARVEKKLRELRRGNTVAKPGRRRSLNASTLSDREYEVIALHFGLEGGEPLSLADVGKRLGVTRQMASTTCKRAITKLAPLLADFNDYA